MIGFNATSVKNRHSPADFEPANIAAAAAAAAEAAAAK